MNVLIEGNPLKITSKVWRKVWKFQHHIYNKRSSGFNWTVTVRTTLNSFIHYDLNIQSRGIHQMNIQFDKYQAGKKPVRWFVDITFNLENLRHNRIVQYYHIINELDFCRNLLFPNKSNFIKYLLCNRFYITNTWHFITHN